MEEQRHEWQFSKSNERVLIRPSFKPPGIPLFICYVGFVSLGLPDTLIGVAWPSVRGAFDLRQSDISWIFFGAGCGYLLSSFFAGGLLKRMNVGVLLAGSSGLVALGGFDFALVEIWLLFALGSLLHGLGSGAIDAGLNHYVASHFSARHMSWLHACYSLGAMLGPIIMTAMIARAGSWRLGYLAVAVILLVLSLLFAATRASWNSPGNAPPADAIEAVTESSTPITAALALRNRTVWLHMVLFFVYTGLEVSLGQWSFTVLTESRSIGLELAGAWVTLYWASILAGRILFGFVVEQLGVDTLVRLSTAVAVAGTALFAWNPLPLASPLALAMAGVGLATVYPCLMTRTPQRLGRQMATHAIGFQVGAAMLGAAALPSLTGWIAQLVGLNSVAAVILIMAAALFVLHETVLLSTTEKGG